MNVLFYVMTFLAVSNTLLAQTRTWDGGGGDNQWATATNWDNDQLPELNADVIISSNDTVYISPGIYSVESISLSNGADVIIQSGATLSTTNGGPSGSDGVRLVGVIDTMATLTIQGTLNISHGSNASGDGLDINADCVTHVTSIGTLNVFNAVGDGIEVGGILLNEGQIMISNSGGSGFNASGTVPGALATVQNNGQITTFGNAVNGIRLIADISMVNDGTLTVYDNDLNSFTSSSGKLTNNGTFIVSGRVKTTHLINAPGSFIDVHSTATTLELNQGGYFDDMTLVFDIDGPTTDQYDQIFISAGGSDLDTTILQLNGTYIPVDSDVFLILEKDSGGPYGGTGIFLGLPEGAAVNFNGVPLYITYNAGDGNDVALIVNNAQSLDNDNDGVVAAFDCNDNDDTIGPNQPEIPNNDIDENCDGIALMIDEDMDGYNSDVDCNDNDASINPDAIEVCDGVDNNCNGTADEGLAFTIYYLDGDNDGYGNAMDSILSCESNAPTGYVTNDADCDDTNGSIHPNVAEECDDIDNNCNGEIDEGLTNTIYYFDADGDGFGDPNFIILSCYDTPDPGYVNNASDCDDTDQTINPDAIEIPNNDVDEDCDGTAQIIDVDSDGFNSNEDCDDNDNTVYPGAPEICDSKDNNCNGSVDEGLIITTYYVDEDADGFGNLSLTVDTCWTTAATGYTTNGEDCDDANAAINPDATEIPNNDTDEDCDGTAQIIDMDMDGYNSDEDCDDSDENINPGATEIPYNGIDEDCNPLTFDDDLDQDGFGIAEDCNDEDATINPDATEIPYNGVDEDCNAQTFDDDLDQDGFGIAEDCNDEDSAINPGVEDIPNNGIDEDCDGSDLIVGLRRVDPLLVAISPNPTKGMFLVVTNQFVNAEIIVTGALGTELLRQPFRGNHVLDITVYPNGIYWLTIKDERHIYQQKLVKQ